MTAQESIPAGRLLSLLESLLALPATDRKIALDRAAQLVLEAFGAEKVDVWLHDPPTETLAVVGISDTPLSRREKQIGMDRVALVMGGRLVGVYRTGEPYLTGRADEDPNVLVGFREALGVRSMVGVPLDVDGKRRGVLLASSTQPDSFSHDDARVLGAVANWVGMVLSRAELVEQIAAEATNQGRRIVAEEMVTILAHD